MRLHFVAFFTTIFSLFLVSPDNERNHQTVEIVNEAVFSGINTNKAYSVEELVKDVFADGVCETITNVQSVGNGNGIGYFSSGTDIIGLEDGIILATGDISNAEGPNSASDVSGNFFDNSGDMDLNLIAIEGVYDAVGITFDFVPLDSFVTFRYVFASEEYCEFVGSEYNDVFGFFVSGPGVSGGFTGDAENVALIPGTTDFVAINSVNRNTNAAFFTGNERQDNADECGVSFIPSQQSNIEYDGFTTVLTATLKVNPCDVYHIRMVIGDVNDNFYDSAVFLEAGSFNLGGRIKVSSVGNPVSGQQLLTEGCDDAYFLFERQQDASTEFPLTVNYYLSNQNTATEGVDFAAIPLTAVIPAGASSISVPVEALNDGLPESGESLAVILDIPCACYADSAVMLIVDPVPVEVDLQDIYVCSGESVQHTPVVSGGNPPYTYLWSTGEGTPGINIAGIGNTHYSVTVFDDCGHFAVDTCLIQITEVPFGMLEGDERVCEGDTAYFQINFSGIPPFDFSYTIDGVEQNPVTDIMSQSFLLPAVEEGTYELIYMSDQVCSGDFLGAATLDIMEIDADITSVDISCSGFSNGSIKVAITGANPPFLLNWSDNLGSLSFIDSLAAGMYWLSVLDTVGCAEQYAIMLSEPAPLSGVTVDCDGLMESELILSANGGTPPYLYSVNGGNFQDASLFETLNVGEHYALAIEDANGCQLEQEFIMPTLYERMFELPETVEVLPNEQHELMLQLNFPESLLASVIWAPSTNLSCTDCLNPIHTALAGGLYFVQVTDVFGCKSFSSIEVTIKEEIDYYIPTIFTPDGDMVNDFFMPYFSEKHVTKVLLFQVFNRWGGMMHEAKNFLPNTEGMGWDGNLDGKPLNSGVFVFLVKVKLRDGNEKTITGDIVLWR